MLQDFGFELVWKPKKELSKLGKRMELKFDTVTSEMMGTTRKLKKGWKSYQIPI